MPLLSVLRNGESALGTCKWWECRWEGETASTIQQVSYNAAAALPSIGMKLLDGHDDLRLGR